MVLRYLLSLGYKEEDINKVLSVFSKLKDEDIYKIVNDKIDYFLCLGFSMEDIIKITVKYPDIFLRNIDVFNKKIEWLLRNGYTMEEILIIFKKNFIVFSRLGEVFYNKIIFYNLIGIGKFFYNDSRSLIQSIELTYARYMFYRTMGIKITEMNYYLLFIEERKFLNKYGKNNKTLMLIYNYDEFLKKNSKCINMVK